MKTTLWILALPVALVWLQSESRSEETDSQVEQGRYLVESVAMCVQCHTPRDARGELIVQRSLAGARIPFASPFPNEQWASSAPKIAGLAGWEEDDFVALLQTGSRPTGETPRSPMPPFRMTRDDATAIYTFLKSLR